MVLDNGLLANFASGYDRTWAESKEINVYLTPYLLSKLKNKVIKPIYNVYSADVFAIGMVLLYAATMRNPHRFYYNWADFSINKEAIERDLIGLQSKYTVSFLRCLILTRKEPPSLNWEIIFMTITMVRSLFIFNLLFFFLK